MAPIDAVSVNPSAGKTTFGDIFYGQESTAGELCLLEEKEVKESQLSRKPREHRSVP